MAENTKKFLSWAGLVEYDSKIKAYIETKDTAVKDHVAANYDAKGAAATALADAKSYADGKDAAIQAAHKAGTDAAAAAAEAARLAGVAQGDVDALETYVGTIPAGATATNVVAYVQEKTAGIASEGAMTELAGRVTTVEGKVATIEGDYLKAADKTELEGKIGEVSTAVATEKSRAEGVESGLNTRLATVEGDYLKAADKTELQGNIDTLTGVVNTLRDGIDADKVDGVKDLIAYVEEHGPEVQGMKEATAAAAKAAADEKTRAEGAESALSGRLDILEAIDHEAYIAADSALKSELNGEIAKKADTTALNSAVQALEGADSALSGRIATLEGKFTGEGSVESQIAAAKKAAIDAAAADATSKANAAESAAKGHADSLNTAMDTRVQALEAIDHSHSNATVLDGITAELVAAWNGAVAKQHEHVNKSVLDGITAAKVSAWDAAEQNAKDYTDGRIAEFVAITTGEVDSLFTVAG